MKNLKNKQKRGFTLVELLVVVTIMGALGAVLITNYSKYVDSSKQTIVKEQLNEIVKTYELAFVTGQKFNNTNLVSFEQLAAIDGFKIKEAYESLAGASLPAGSTLVISPTTLTYTQDGKVATYSFK